LRIALISKADSAGGGASRVAEGLSLGLWQRGHEAVHFSAWTARGFGGLHRPLYGESRVLRAAIKKAHALSQRVGPAELLPLELLPLFRAGISSFDIVHFHDLSSAISPFTLSVLSRRIPVLWTFHDCSPFTGGCLYPMDCTRYRTRCNHCPQLGEWPLDATLDCTRLMQTIKMRLHADGRVTCLAPSHWMARMAVDSGKIAHPPTVVPNGVDTHLFRPSSNRSALRDRLGIRSDRPTLLASAGHIGDPRKGIGYAVAAVRRLADLDPLLLLVGAIEKENEKLLQGIRWQCTGYLSDARRIAECYSVADLFLFCSLADNQPLAVLESLACGTPVVGFATGGVPEIVPQGKCGWLVPQGNVDELAKIMRDALMGGIGEEWPHNARRFIERQHSMEVHLERHLQVYLAAVREPHGVDA
jgi:glycosyltransferase involved in cell wall biosynthesis